MKYDFKVPGTANIDSIVSASGLGAPNFPLGIKIAGEPFSPGSFVGANFLINASTSIVLDSPLVEIASASSHAGVVGVPSKIHPVGWSILIRNNTTGQVAIYSQT